VIVVVVVVLINEPFSIIPIPNSNVMVVWVMERLLVTTTNTKKQTTTNNYNKQHNSSEKWTSKRWAVDVFVAVCGRAVHWGVTHHES
jgi:hypothetical protein